jgi:hypothetical protein
LRHIILLERAACVRLSTLPEYLCTDNRLQKRQK